METLLALFWNILVPTLVVAFGTWLFYQVKGRNIKFSDLFAKFFANKSTDVINNHSTEKMPEDYILVKFFSKFFFEKNFRGQKKKGVYIGPFTVQFIRAGIFLISTVLSASILILVDNLFFESGVKTLYHWLFSGLLAFLLITPDGPEIEIDAAHVAVLTFLGNRYRAYFVEGKYDYLFRRFGIDIYTKPLPHYKNIGTSGAGKGFIPIRKLSMTIFNTKPKGGNGEVTITSLAKNRVPVSCTLTLTIEIDDPLLFMNSDDPLLQLGEGSRSALRSLVTNFTDNDLVSLKSAIQELLQDNILVTAFNLKSNNSKENGSLIDSADVVNKSEMVHDTKGVPLYEIITSAADRDEAESKISSKVNPAQKQFALHDDKLNIVSVQLSPTSSIVETLRRIGVTLLEVQMSDIHQDPEREKAKIAIAVEGDQAMAQKISAQTQETVSGILQNAGLDPKTAALAALKVDKVDGVTIIHQSESDGNRVSSVQKAAAIIGEGLKK